MDHKITADAEKFFEKISNVNLFAEDVINSFPNGLSSLFKVPSPPAKGVFVMMMLNCSEAFQKKYSAFFSDEQAGHIEIAEDSSANKKGDKKLNDCGMDHFNDERYVDSDISDQADVNAIRADIDNEEIATEKAVACLNDIFEKLDFGSDDLVDAIIKVYSEKKAQKIKELRPRYYKIALDHMKDKYPNEEVPYYCEIHFDDIVFLMCSILKVFTSLTIRLELGNIPNSLNVIFYGTEPQYNFLADLFDYELQLRPYAIKYEAARKKFQENKGNLKSIMEKTKEHNQLISNDSEDKALLDHIDLKADNNAMQFEDLDLDKPILWPPYVEFEQKKDDKYRLYEPNDQYHECSIDDIPKAKLGNAEGHHASKFRNIDKLRLVSDSLDKFLRLNFLRNKGILKTIVYKRNYESYEQRLTFTSLFSEAWNIFNQKTFLSFINFVRNFYGEVTSYYFLWVESYMIWLLFPSAVGVLMGIIAIISPFSKEPIGKTPITVMDILMILYCVIIAIWATLFLKTWKQKEKLFAYIWGTENFIHNEPDSEDFTPDKSIDFIFGKSINIVYPFFFYMKKAVSYFVLLIMIVATCSITFLLLYNKKNYFKPDTAENYWYNTIVSMGFACVNAVQIKIFNFIYVFIAEKLNHWENYQKEFQKFNDLAIKLIIFDFMNCYAACFYIGFLKPNINDPCIGTCMQELETQLYTTLLMNFGLNIVEVAFPFGMYKLREYAYKKKLPEEERKNWNVVTHSILHQLFCDENNNMIYEYNELIILFGYLCLFSVTAPFTPLLVLLLVWTEKLLDVFKRFFYERSQNLNQATGIEIYNVLMKVLMFVGMLTNVGVVLFSKEFKVNNDVFYKVIIFFCVENFIILLMFVLNWNILPVWFNYIQDLKELYDKKFFRRRNVNLPHYSAKSLSKAFIPRNDKKKDIKLE